MQVRRREYLLAYLAVVLAIAFTAAPAVAMYPGGGGGGGCPTATVTFRIYETTQNPWAGSVGSITFGVNSNTYLDGGTATVSVNCGMTGYPISAWAPSPWQFDAWVTSTDGHFGSPTSASTVFYTGSSGGIIALILYKPAEAGGYESYAKSQTQSSALITLPNSLSWVDVLSPVSTDYGDFLPLGVSLGGVNAQPTFQSGVMIIIPKPGSTTTFCDTGPGSGGCYTTSVAKMCGYTMYMPNLFSAVFHFYCNEIPGISYGHSVFVQAQYNPQYGTVSFTIIDRSTGYGLLTAVSFTPDLTTAIAGVLALPCSNVNGNTDAFVHAPNGAGGGGSAQSNCYGMPNFGPISFSGVSSSAFPNLAGSVLHSDLQGYALSDYSGIQWAAAGGLAPTNPASFSVTYYH